MPRDTCDQILISSGILLYLRLRKIYNNNKTQINFVSDTFYSSNLFLRKVARFLPCKKVYRRNEAFRQKHSSRREELGRNRRGEPSKRGMTKQILASPILSEITFGVKMLSAFLIPFLGHLNFKFNIFQLS